MLAFPRAMDRSLSYSFIRTAVPERRSTHSRGSEPGRVNSTRARPTGFKIPNSAAKRSQPRQPAPVGFQRQPAQRPVRKAAVPVRSTQQPAASAPQRQTIQGSDRRTPSRRAAHSSPNASVRMVGRHVPPRHVALDTQIGRAAPRPGDKALRCAFPLYLSFLNS